MNGGRLALFSVAALASCQSWGKFWEVSVEIKYKQSQYVFHANTAISALTPTITGTLTRCAVSPDLPTGLSLDATTCSITGTPSTQTAPATYTVTATGPSGTSTASIIIRIGGLTPYRVIGQYGNTACGASNNNGSCVAGTLSANTLSAPNAVVGDAQGNIVISDYNNRRVLYYPADVVAAGGNITATKVYGQYGNFSCAVNFNNGSCVAGTATASNTAPPTGAFIDKDGNVYVTDGSRMLMFSSDPLIAASRVYGQNGSFTTSAANMGGTASALTLSGAQGIAMDSSGGLYVAEAGNNRALYFASGSTTASRVYGHFGAFNCSLANENGACAAGTRSADTLSGSGGVAVDSSGNLYISESSNHRILFFPAGQTTATKVYGQAGSFATATTGISATAFNGPWGMALDAYDNLYVADYNNNRVLFYPKDSTTATRVYGQQGNFGLNTANNGGLATGLTQAQTVGVDVFGNVFIVDTGNNRVLIF